MKKHPNPAASDQTQATVARTGTTLSEVLVSMLIMSIGVVSLAALFPISVLRTAQATQLTHSVFLRNNAEAAVESKVGLLSNAQLAAPTTMDVGNPDWITYGVIDPLHDFLSPAKPNFGGIASRPRISGGVTTLEKAEQLAALPDSWSLVLEDSVDLGSPPTPTQIKIKSTPAGLNPRNGQSLANANHRMILYDGTGKLAVLKNLYQVSGSNLIWQDIDSMGNPVSTSSLPSGFTPTRVRVEVQDRRYTWLMTARKKRVSSSPTDSSWAAELDVAVFYNRSFRAADETAYSLTFPVDLELAGSLTAPVKWTGFDGEEGVRGVNDDNDVDANGNPNVDEPDESGFPGSDDNRTVIVTFTAGSKPYLKKGGYMLEPSQLKWYRILDLKDVSSNVATNTETVLLLDQDLRYTPTSLATVPTIPTVGGISGIFMKGIIEVYPLGSRTGRE